MSCASSGASSLSLSSGCPARMIRSTLSLVVSTPDSRRISSSTRMVRFCASSTISSTLRPAAYCSIRKLLTVLMSSALRILKGEKPNCTSTACRKSMADTWVWLICATTTSAGTSLRKDSISVVLPEPISPVITTKPSVNQMVDSMYALARACCFDRYRNWGSGLSRNGNSLSLKGSRYMLVDSQPMLRDANADGQILEQAPRASVTQGGGRLDHGAVTHLAPGPRLLAVVVQVHPIEGQQGCACGHLPDEIDHGAVAERSRGAERQVEDGTQVIHELTGGGALDGPVSGVVHPRRHLVGDEPAAAHEELDGQDAGIAKMRQHASEIARGQALPARRPERRAGESQDTSAVDVAAQRIDREPAADAARADDRRLAIKRDPLLIQQRCRAERAPGRPGVRGRADHGLALAVVAEPACLEHTGQADGGDGARQLRARAHGAPAGGGNPQALEQALLGHPVLAGGERRDRRTDTRAVQARHGSQARNRHVLPVEGQDLATARQAGDPARGRLARGVQTQEIQPQRIARQSEHAAELAGAHDADRHVRGVARGSGVPSTPAVWRSRYASSAVAMAGCLLARIAAAHSAALVAPAAPIANVATGTPAGICTMDNNESSPPRDFDCTGTPSTGRLVLAAVMPGRCAAPPAPAISTSSPRARAAEAYSNNRSGVRCADTT